MRKEEDINLLTKKASFYLYFTGVFGGISMVMLILNFFSTAFVTPLFVGLVCWGMCATMAILTKKKIEKEKLRIFET